MKKMKRNSKSMSKDMMVAKYKCSGNKCGNCGYFLGFIGAAIYYIQTATSFWLGVLGLLKAAVWPVFLVLEVLKYLGA